ncbi:cell division protein FtsQ/DivIB [Aquihabitans daechungensis]|uniref:cell division protein FtsQ/DivIB n=1 Tax=Aquihabitans daechungensis TaxID=1052257 RepID=UPI003B9F3ED1
MSTETVFRQRAKAPKPPKGSKAPGSPKSPKPPKAPKTSKAAKGPKRIESPSFVDPRLQARRVEVARGQGRRRLRWILLAVVVVVLLVGAFAVTQSPALDVDEVAVRGASRTEQAEARAASGIAIGSPLVSLDAPAVERRLEALPWVEQASVSRSWPGTVRISLVERTPVAVVGSGAGAVQVDRDGRALGPASDDGLPVVSGDAVVPGEELPPTQRWVVATIADLPAELRSEVAAASATPSGIRLTLTDGIEVRWGDSSQPTAKADAVQVLLEQADRATIAAIDVTVPRAATVTRS